MRRGALSHAATVAFLAVTCIRVTAFCVKLVSMENGVTNPALTVAMGIVTGEQAIV